MKAELVRARLAELRERYVPETVSEARARLATERPPVNKTLTTQSVARALAELRALCDLSTSLLRRR